MATDADGNSAERADGDSAEWVTSIDEERHTELDVEGEVPAWLDGSLVRNGPGTFDIGDQRVGHYFDGLAMLRKFGFRDGRVTYRNRFLRTDAYEDATNGEYSGGFGTDESLSVLERVVAFLRPASPTDNTNVNVWRFGGDHAALTETKYLTLFDPETLETTGLTTYRGEPEAQQVSGHPHHDRDRGETVSMSTYYGRQTEYRVWRQADDSWERETVCRIPVDKPAYLHSFALTDRYVVLVEFPLVVSPLKLLIPSNEAFIKRFEWEPDRGTRFRVVDRQSGEVVAEPVTEAFFCFHHVNAYEDPGDGRGAELVVDMVTFPDARSIDELYFEDGTAPSDVATEGAQLSRCRVSLGGRTDAAVERRRLHEGHLGMPRVSPDVYASEYRYVYAHGEPGEKLVGFPESVLKVDVETGEAVWRDLGGYVSEPVFVPHPDEDAEDAGVVLTVALGPDGDRSILYVFDAADLALLAEAPLPHHLPMDFHGQFFPGVH